MTHMHSSVKKVHQYAHHTYQHLGALMKEVISSEDLKTLNLPKPPVSAIRPPQQYRRCATPPLAIDSYSSNQEMTAEEAEDTAACPRTATACLKKDSPPTRSIFCGALASVFPFFVHFYDKGGEIC